MHRGYGAPEFEFETTTAQHMCTPQSAHTTFIALGYTYVTCVPFPLPAAHTRGLIIRERGTAPRACPKPAHTGASGEPDLCGDILPRPSRSLTRGVGWKVPTRPRAVARWAKGRGREGRPPGRAHGRMGSQAVVRCTHLVLQRTALSVHSRVRVRCLLHLIWARG